MACTLHGRHRADGRTAKPDLCFEWPPKDKGLHPGCVFQGRKRAKKGEASARQAGHRAHFPGRPEVCKFKPG